MRKWLSVACVLALMVWPSLLPAQAAQETPSISARFETSRDFGYHIGDLIPLTLLIETQTGVVIDLESLPHRGEPVGPFEVRNARIERSATVSGSAYRIEFALQGFVPATSAAGLVFPPLELRFALPDDRAADGGYVYRSVTLPPHAFFLSPTAIGPSVLRPNKASVVPRTGWLFWSSLSLGAGFLALGLAMLAGDAIRWWTRRSREEHTRAARRALGTLGVLRERYVACDEKTPTLFLKVNGVLRRFLREQCRMPARGETTQQIRERFRGHPLEKQLEELFERSNEVIYDGLQPSQAEKEGMIRAVTTLVGQLDRIGCPVNGGNGATR